MKVLDASGIINARDRVIEGGFITVTEVIRELKDIQSRYKLESAIAEGKIKVEEPSDKAFDKVEEAAEKSGVLPLLSITDMKILALAHEKDLPILTDDYDIQNMCWLMGIGFETIAMPGIKEPYTWKKKCTACGKEYQEDVAECEACGSRHFKIMRKSKE